MVNIEERKHRLIMEYGLEPTICYFYYLLNAVDYAGEENVRKSFESIQGQGDEIIVGDYSSTDDTVKIAKEYGFKVVEIEKTPGITFHMSKVVNKILKESKSNFMGDLDLHMEYPKNLTNVSKDWILRSDIRTKMLALRGDWINEKGNFETQWGFSSILIYYKPYLLEARGYDERTYMGYGCTHYFLDLLREIYGLSFYNMYINNMIHKYHKDKKISTMSKLGFSDISKGYLHSLSFAKSLIDELKIDFDKGVKNVKNSYW